MISFLALAVAHWSEGESIFGEILRERPSVVMQYWSQETKDKSHLFCITSQGKISRDLKPQTSYSAVKVSPDFSTLAVARQVAASASEKRDYITEVPYANTIVQIGDSREKLFERTIHERVGIFWQGPYLRLTPDSGTSVTKISSTGAWTYSDFPYVDGNRAREYATPQSLGDYFVLDSRRSETVFKYTFEGKQKTCALKTEIPTEVISLAGTSSYVYIDGIHGGVYMLDARTGISQKSNIPHFERAAWVADSKILALTPLETVPRPTITLYHFATKKLRVLALPNRSVRNFIALNSRELLVSSTDNGKRPTFTYLDRLDPATGKVTPVLQLKHKDSPWIQLDACTN